MTSFDLMSRNYVANIIRPDYVREVPVDKDWDTSSDVIDCDSSINGIVNDFLAVRLPTPAGFRGQ